MALDSLRATLIDLRPKTMSFSTVFPRGVLLVSKSDALDASSSDGNNGN